MFGGIDMENVNNKWISIAVEREKPDYYNVKFDRSEVEI